MYPVQVSTLPENEIVLNDVYDGDGNLLFQRGTRFDKRAIDALARHDIRQVYLRNEEEALSLTRQRPAHRAVSFDRFTGVAEILSANREPGIVPPDLLDEAEESLDDVFRTFAEGGSPDLKRIRKTATNLADVTWKAMRESPHNGLRLNDLRLSSCSIYTHSVNVALMSAIVAAKATRVGANLVYAIASPSEAPPLLADIALGALLHDAGYARLGIDMRHGLSCPWVDSADIESASPIPIATHPEIGHNQLADSGLNADAALEIVYNHHERHDGLGYPRKLSGDQLSLPTGLVAVANDFEKLAIGSAQGDTIVLADIMCLIMRDTGKAYSPPAARLFCREMGIYPVGSFVQLSTGEIGLVVENATGNILTPRLMIIRNPEGRELSEFTYLNLHEAPGVFIERVVDPVVEFEFHSGQKEGSQGAGLPTQ